jgi:membrane fusion protein, multidrug efflux system
MKIFSWSRFRDTVIPACPGVAARLCWRASFFKKDSRPAYRTGRRALLAGMTALSYFIAGMTISVLAFSVSGCSSKGDAGTAKSDKSERPPVAVETLPAKLSELTEGIDVVGTLAPKCETEVKSQIVGLVREVYVTEWVKVKKGDPLARIDTSEIEALVKKAEAAIESSKAGLLQAQVSAQRSEREKARIMKLREFGLSTEQNLDDAKSEAFAADARVEASRAQIRAAEADLKQLQVRRSKGLIRSPMDGVVSLKDVNVGDLASDAAVAKPLFKIVDNRILNITVTVPSTEMAKVKSGDALTFSVDALPGKTFSGKVMHVNPSVDEADRSVKVIAEVPNTSGELKGGLFAKGRIETGTRRNVIQIPRSALIGFNVAAKKAGLYVVKNDIAHYVEAVTGALSGDQVEIASGLNPGDKLVVRGGFNLKDNDKVVVPAGRVK